MRAEVGIGVLICRGLGGGSLYDQLSGLEGLGGRHTRDLGLARAPLGTVFVGIGVLFVSGGLDVACLLLLPRLEGAGNLHLLGALVVRAEGGGLGALIRLIASLLTRLEGGSRLRGISLDSSGLGCRWLDELVVGLDDDG